ncbi:transcription factor MYBS2-like [Dioscorea cayenensis subsp. rotundata]|uniref:Transcription factor MYBS2-like n=1 Tax=Dioscorea cayennensis subsp. rotundata TaxID=55577 RepID=A0AB40BIH2_DIOCR|nr:transcription factor MYBS2-like [Dioscorea cayenensis subsp. rotundata]
MEKEMRLFGVKIVERKLDIKEDDKGHGEEGEEKIRKTQSLNNLSTITIKPREAKHQGYLSDGLNIATSSKAKSRGYVRKKGRPWTTEEHMTFLIGMERLGKGDWKGISKNFVRTRTASQIASHAQEYFLRQINPKKKSRDSLFDAPVITMVCPFGASGMQHLHQMVGGGDDGIWKKEQFPVYSVSGQVFPGLNSCFNANVSDFQRVSTGQTQRPTHPIVFTAAKLCRLEHQKD